MTHARVQLIANSPYRFEAGALGSGFGLRLGTGGVLSMRRSTLSSLGGAGGGGFVGVSHSDLGGSPAAGVGSSRASGVMALRLTFRCKIVIQSLKS